MMVVMSEASGDHRNPALEVAQATFGAFRFTDSRKVEHAGIACDLPGPDDPGGASGARRCGFENLQRRESVPAVRLRHQPHAPGLVRGIHRYPQRCGVPGGEGEVVERYAGTGHVPVDHAAEPLVGADPVVVPVVVHADDLIRREFALTGSPGDHSGRAVRGNDLVVPREPAHRVREYVVRYLWAIRRTRKVVEDLATPVVVPVHPRYAGQAGVGQVVEQGMNRRSPRSGGAADRVADADRTADVAAR